MITSESREVGCEPLVAENHPASEICGHLGPLDECPTCGGHGFVISERDGAVIFQCTGCSAGWRYELGFVWPVDIGEVGSSQG